MKKVFKGIISIILVISMIMGVAIPAFAKSEEEYLSELRLVYAETYEKATQVLKDSKLDNYQVLNENLNSETGKIGVWLAYKTTTNIDDAITDISVMQMGGGYSAGNYRALIESSKEEYFAMGEIYLQAIEYFMEAYDAGSFLAEAAYRQLNFYVGLDFYEDDRLGDLFVENVLTPIDLSTLFLQGNSHVLKNIRSLLSMGVSYNEDGMTYLEKVGESAEKMNANPNVFDNDGYEELAAVIAPNIMVFRNMFEELSAYEDELNYEDDTFVDLEIKYSIYMAIAEMMRAVPYIADKSLYDFCMDYIIDIDDYSYLYPLVDALNQGQAAMTMASCYYDVVRYSMSEELNEVIDEEISKLEETYSETPIDVYIGVDRSIYEETFALTSNASRADAYNDSNSLSETMFSNAWMLKNSYISLSAVDVGLSIWAINKTSDRVSDAEAAESTSKAIARYTSMFQQAINAVGGQSVNAAPFINTAIKKYTFFDLVYELLYNYDKKLPDPNWTFKKMYDCFMYEVVAGGMTRSEEAKALLKILHLKMDDVGNAVVKKPISVSKMMAEISSKFTTLFYFLDASVLVASAISLGIKVYDHYHPVYDDIPTAMVDIVGTDEGDKYVKYNVVREITKKDGVYPAADLNAFKGQRWNALYYTKDAEAGKPLLVEFVLSQASNRAEDGYLAVHRFGEGVCYDLNKYNFLSDADNVFLSIAQSENKKSDVEDLPVVVGSVFGSGFWFLAGGVGFVVGIGATIGTQFILKKKKKKKSKVDIEITE